MKLRMALLLSMTIGLMACNTHVHEPWVPNPEYLKQERSRTSMLNQKLDQRVYYQRDR